MSIWVLALSQLKLGPHKDREKVWPGLELNSFQLLLHLLNNKADCEIYEIHILYCSCRWKWKVIIAVNFPIYAIGRKKPEKYQGFNGIQTRDPRDNGVMLDQLSCEATHREQGQFVEFISSRAVKWCEIYEIHILYCGCRWKWRVIIAVNFPI